MKKSLLLLFTIFSMTQSYAQVQRFDKFDNYKKERFIQFQASSYKSWMASDGIAKNLLKSSMYLMTHIVQNTDTKEATTYLTLDIRNSTKICSSENNEAVLTLNNGELVQLFQNSKTECGTNIVTKYTLNESQLSQLSIHDVVSIRVYLNDGYTDREIKEKSKSVIKKTIQMTVTKLKEIE